MQCDRQIMQETEALMALTSVGGLGSIKIRLLVERYGSAVAALEATPEELRELPGFTEKIISTYTIAMKSQTWRRNLELVEQEEAQVISYHDARYPKKLLDLTDYPVILYVRGTLLPQDTQSIAVVGTRAATLYGKEMAYRIASDLASLGFTVVSGLARGIDTQAHLGALETGRTMAVIGSGLADIYPEENRVLAERIASRGALISEFPMATPPDRQNFPQRNRIVAAMTLGTFLVEAPNKSGAMITMDRARDLRRKLFALPGRADIDSFCGNHSLIKEGQAALVENAHDIAKSFDHLFVCVPNPTRKAELPPLEAEETQLLSLLNDGEISIEEIAHRSGLKVVKLNVLLMSLVLKKRIKEFPGKLYKKC